ncbi:MAG: dethiobiotin synthase [Caulobacteraceae bacterium]
MKPDDLGKRRLIRAFDGAARTYDAHAPIQRAVAERLAERIAALPLPPRPRILEIGCGTGLLTAALRRRIGPADWTVTDLSPAMLAVCRERLGHPADAAFAAMDGERAAFAPGTAFDLICSSLAFQWFDDLPAAVARLTDLLAPGGWLAFATLAEGSFAEWRRAHDDLGLVAATPAFPSLRALADMGAGRVEAERLVHVQPDGRAFLDGLKRIGAHAAPPGRRPLAPADLKRVIARFEAMGAGCSYQVAYGLFRRPATAPRGVFVTGTDTGVGKTVVAACLARAWGADYWKPVQTGLAEEPGDTETVARLAGLAPSRLHPPAYEYAAPLSPHLAAAREGAAIDPAAIALPASDRPVVVEGAGGALVPLHGDVLTADLIARLGLPAVVVVRNRLGAISHALLTLEALRGRGVEVLGVVLTGDAFADNRAAIERVGRVRILAELPWAETVDAACVAEWAALIPPLDERRITGLPS